MHEASRECVWLRSVIQHIRESCGLSSIKNEPTVLYEDNVACIAQVKGGYTDLFTKALPTATFKKLVRQIGMRQLKDLQNEVSCHHQGEHC